MELVVEQYKQTEVGLIPVDWDVVNFGDIIDYIKGFAFKSRDYQRAGIKIIRVSDTTFDSIKEENGIFIKEEYIGEYKKWKLEESDLIFTTVGSKPPMYDSMVGKVIMVRKEFEGSLLNQNAVLIRAKKRTKEKQSLLLNHFRTKRYLNHIELIYRGNANQASITLKELFEYKIPLPPTLTEQTAIATALSDADALISSLEKLIVKKRNIKQGAMQEFLTGKRRLPGFERKKDYKQTELGLIPNDWNIKEFEEVMDGFTSGQTPYRANSAYYKGNIPWITSGELNYNVITDTIEKITLDGVREANLKMIPKGTFLFAITGLEAAGTRGSCAITGIEATTNQSCMALYPKKGLLTTTYLYYYYLRYGNELAFKYCQGTKQQSYTGGVAKKLPIIIPPTIEEQTAIATILSDMDVEITALETMLDKYRKIKQGMMQNLLTGKIRLV